jgi:hypothetical protein
MSQKNSPDALAITCTFGYLGPAGTQTPEVFAMTTLTTYKLNVKMPAGYARGLRGAASPQDAIGVGFTDGSLAVRLKR